MNPICLDAKLICLLLIVFGCIPLNLHGQYDLPEVKEGIKESIVITYNNKGDEIRKEIKRYDVDGRIMSYEMISEKTSQYKTYTYPSDNISTELFVSKDTQGKLDTIWEILWEESYENPGSFAMDIEYGSDRYWEFYESSSMEPTLSIPFDAKVFGIKTSISISNEADRIIAQRPLKGRDEFTMNYIYQWRADLKKYLLEDVLIRAKASNGQERVRLMDYNHFIDPTTMYARYSKVYNEKGDIVKFENVYTTIKIPSFVYKYTEYDELDNWTALDVFEDRRKIENMKREIVYY